MQQPQQHQPPAGWSVEVVEREAPEDLPDGLPEPVEIAEWQRQEQQQQDVEGLGRRSGEWPEGLGRRSDE